MDGWFSGRSSLFGDWLYGGTIYGDISEGGHDLYGVYRNWIKRERELDC